MAAATRQAVRSSIPSIPLWHSLEAFALARIHAGKHPEYPEAKLDRSSPGMTTERSEEKT
jgi:hypothetical protein